MIFSQGLCRPSPRRIRTPLAPAHLSLGWTSMGHHTPWRASLSSRTLTEGSSDRLRRPSIGADPDDDTGLQIKGDGALFRFQRQRKSGYSKVTSTAKIT